MTSAASPSPTPSPPPPRPKTASSARFAGHYNVTYVLISSRIPGTKSVVHYEWHASPICRSGGECDAVVNSGKVWKIRAAFLAGRYRFTHTVPKAETCGSGGHVDYYITVIYEYSVAMNDMALIDGQWMATGFDGTIIGRGTRGCGLSAAGVDERWAAHGRLVR